MSLLEPQCEHEKLGHVLARAYTQARERVNILELPGSGFRLEGLTRNEWHDASLSYQAQMVNNLELHQKECV